MSELRSSAAEAIGNTPLVELSRLFAADSGRVFAKLEFLNPGGSKKDRIARQIVADGAASGALAPGQTVVELTSGNTGTGLAIVCAAAGHPFVAVQSKGNSPERARMMRALGAEVVLVDQAPGGAPGRVTGADLDLVEAEAQRLTRERDAFRADQFENTAGVRAHELTTAPEILAQCGGRLDAFCDFVGSAGSFTGCARAFKAHDPAVQCYVVEPQGAAVLAGEAVQDPQHVVQGGGYARPGLTLLDRSLVDGYLTVTDAEATAMTREVARTEGLFAGFSTGANLAAAKQLLAGPCAGGTIVVLACDSGMKYLSTSLWQ